MKIVRSVMHLVLASATATTAFAQGSPPPGGAPQGAQQVAPPVGPPSAAAQPPAARGGARPGARAPGRMGMPQGLAEDDPRRLAMERRFQDRLLTVVKQRLSLNDDQVARLRDVASKTEDDRRALRRDELTARFAMRQELLAADKANDARVADLLDQLPKLERRRVELMEREQRELAKFLSPVQRARYFGLQEELRRGMQELQQQRLMAPDSVAPGARGGAGRGAAQLRRNRLRPPPL